jgi:DNA-binding NarL/FixJ family response regulator
MSSVGYSQSTAADQHAREPARKAATERVPEIRDPAEGERGAKKSPIVIISVRLLSRECLARVLNVECGASVNCFSTIDEWLAVDPSTPVSLVVLCQWGRSNAEALKEVERLSEVSEQIGNCPAVILSDNEDPDLIVQMLGKNVRGYVPTSLSINVAVQAMELARAGGVFVPASSLLAAHRHPDSAAATVQKCNGLFTARQAAVVEALRRGKANKIIAYELNMRESTVKVHVRNIMKKLRATNRTEVAYLANRLLEGEEPLR